MFTIQQYSITDVRDEVRALVTRGLIGPQHRIYELRKHFNDRQWLNCERMFAENDYLLRDRIIDLIGKESWHND